MSFFDPYAPRSRTPVTRRRQPRRPDETAAETAAESSGRLALRRKLAPDVSVDPTDVAPAKRALQRLGHYRAPDQGITPYPDRDLFAGIARFQAERGLTRDGTMAPGGETERAVNRQLAALDREVRGAGPAAAASTRGATARQQQTAGRGTGFAGQQPEPEIPPRAVTTVPRHTPQAVFGIGGPVGPAWKLGGGANAPQDVIATKRGLAWAGFYPPERAGDSDVKAKADLFEAIARFQQAPKRYRDLKVDSWLGRGGETEAALERAIAPRLRLMQAQAESEAEQMPEAADRPEARAWTENRDALIEQYEDRRLDAIGNRIDTMVEAGDAVGLNRAAVLWRHFREGSGEPVRIPLEETLSDPFFVDAAEKNRDRTARNTFTGTTSNNSELNTKLRGLEDGGVERDLTDTWVVNQSDPEAFRQIFEEGFPKGPDSFAQFGRRRLESEVVFNAVRRGDQILVAGTVEHSRHEPYDFHKGRLGDMLGAKDLQDAGRGTPFEIEGSWKQAFEGTIQVLGQDENGLILGVPRIVWGEPND